MSAAAHRNGIGGLFIPAGILLGFGIGAIWDQALTGFFIGIGMGFLLFAISTFFTAK